MEYGLHEGPREEKGDPFDQKIKKRDTSMMKLGLHPTRRKKEKGEVATNERSRTGPTRWGQRSPKKRFHDGKERQRSDVNDLEKNFSWAN